MTNAQTEARAIASKVVDLARSAIRGAVVCHGEMTTAEVESEAADIGLEVADLIAAALAAKDAKCRALDDECQQSMLDIARERDRAERAEASRNGYAKDAAARADECARLRAQLAEARKALEPFAEFADDMDRDGRDLPDDCGIYAFKAGDFRAARRAREQGGQNG